ncbi:MAG: tagaturonate epimerase family protein [Clostridia bacterium]|nr:tagaturonate epimerase family protein [Clostridia bacterium]
MQIYEKSRHTSGATTVSMAREAERDVLVIEGRNPGFAGEVREGAIIAPADHQSAVLLRQLFPFTAPRPVLSSIRTVGLGDRLGIATPGHIRVMENYDAVPILAQQSIRELNLTERTFMDVLDCATFAVFREDFQRGFGADGDHLKTDDEVEYALGCGYSMITLDCSEHIRNDVADMTDEQVNAAYQPDQEMEKLYLGKSFKVEDHTIEFPEMEYKRTALIYGAALDHAAGIYSRHVKGKPVDFEISIDETMTPTTPAQHYFVASELTRRGVAFATVAPRFCGEFQKGIDYIGDLAQFTRELDVHAAIARAFGYKLSIHSGSDKFSVFPIIGKLTRGNFHVKTAGTNWLEAMRVVAMTDAALYREVHAFALSAFDEATKYYHVTTDLSKIPALDTLKDSELPDLFSQNDARQLIHITYGLILTAKNADGASRFKERLYKLWRENEETYYKCLAQHIGRHMRLLYQDIR